MENLQELFSYRKQDVQAVMERSFFEDCLLFDVANEGRIVACRSPRCRDRTGEYFFDLLTPDAAGELRAYLLGYHTKPIITETRFGIAVVVPTVMPSSALGIAVLPQMERRTLLRLLSRIEKQKDSEDEMFAWSGSLREEAQGRAVPDMAVRREALEEIMTDIRLCLYEYAPTNASKVCRIDEYLEQQLYRLSYFAGCPIDLIRKEKIMSYGDFDFALFTAYMLSVLFLCRRIAPCRKADILLMSSELGGMAEIRIGMEGKPSTIFSEILWMEALAASKNIYFDYAMGEELLQLCFVPVNRDWSYLELKAHQDFDWVWKKETKNEEAH